MADIPATADWAGNRRYIGKATKRDYGRIGHGAIIMADPRDVAADMQLNQVGRTFIPSPQPRPAVKSLPPTTPPEPVVVEVAEDEDNILEGANGHQEAAQIEEPLPIEEAPKPEKPPELTTAQSLGQKVLGPPAPSILVPATPSPEVVQSWQQTIERLQAGEGFHGPYVSIVTGTYNRLEHLQAMVESVRTDCKAWGLPYEIIIVDGGSTDGTLEWLHDQNDIITIEHGKLLGAIKAFNDGAIVARARYVILANDDITFAPNSIFNAALFMDNNPDVGQGAFPQERMGRSAHVSPLGAMKDGQPVTVIYGQVSITRKWLGEKVGWWGNFGSRTYAGDNFLSAGVWEAGYAVRAIPGALIKDGRVEDQLRYDNGPGRRLPDNTHPDSRAYRTVYPDGPHIGCNPFNRPNDEPVPLARVLYVPLVAPKCAQYGQKRGLEEALKRRALVYTFDQRGYAESLGTDGMKEALQQVARQFKPDLFLFQVHTTRLFQGQDILALREAHPNALFVNWDGDKILHFKDLRRGKLDLNSTFHLQTCKDGETLPFYESLGLCAMFWNQGFEPDIQGAEPDGDTPAHDVVYFGNIYRDNRREMERVVLKAAKEQGFTYAFYGEGWQKKAGNTHYDFRRTGQIQRNCQIVLSDTTWPDAPLFHSNRLEHALAAGGALTFQQRFKGMETLGLEHEVNCIVWDRNQDLPELIAYWLNARGGRATKRKRIIEAGQCLAEKTMSFDALVKQLADKLLPAIEEHPANGK